MTNSMEKKDMLENSREHIPKDKIVLAKTRFSFSEKARRALDHLISLIPSELENSDNICVETDFHSFAQACGIGESEHAYGEIKTVLRELAGKVVWLISGHTETTERWIKKAMIDKQEKRITVWISPEMLQYSRQCQNILPYDINGMKSQYSMRLLSLLHGKGTDVRFSVKELKDQLLLNGECKSYENFKNFRKAVLEPALKGINETDHYTVTMEMQYHGKKISHVIFHVKETISG